MQPDQCHVPRLAHALLEQYTTDIISMLQHEDELVHIGMQVNMHRLLAAVPEFVHPFLHSPAAGLTILDDALYLAQQLVHPACDMETTTLKRNAHVRCARLPTLRAFVKDSIVAVRAADCGKLAALTGTVVRALPVKLLEAVKVYECTKCKHRFEVKFGVEHDHTIDLPLACPSRLSEPDPKKACPSAEFQCIADATRCVDYQEIRMQEAASGEGVGSIPRSICIVLHNTLADSCKVGDAVLVHGVVAHRWRRLAVGARCELETLVKANNITVLHGSKTMVGSKRPWTGAAAARCWWHQQLASGMSPCRARARLLQSIAPQIHGMHLVKLAIGLSMFGGGRVSRDGMQTRGDVHVLLVGDPGTAKSQMLRWCSSTAPRAVLTTGSGTTSAGLTCAASRDSSGQIAFDAGALVLADGSICCIDEFSGVSPHDLQSVHEAMEQQSVSVAKSGAVVRLNTRCAVIAACNARGGRWDPSADITVNTGLQAPMLSRFDIMFNILDQSTAQRDAELSAWLLEKACADFQALVARKAGRSVEDAPGSAMAPPPMSARVFQEYMLWAKQIGEVQLTRLAQDMLTEYYTKQRSAGMYAVSHPQLPDGVQGVGGAGRATIRMLESTIRLAQAHARLCARSTGTCVDAMVAIYMVDCSMGSSALLPHAALQMFAGQPLDEQNLHALLSTLATHLQLVIPPHAEARAWHMGSVDEQLQPARQTGPGQPSGAAADAAAQPSQAMSSQATTTPELHAAWSCSTASDLEPSPRVSRGLQGPPPPTAAAAPAPTPTPPLLNLPADFYDGCWSDDGGETQSPSAARTQDTHAQPAEAPAARASCTTPAAPAAQLNFGAPPPASAAHVDAQRQQHQHPGTAAQDSSPPPQDSAAVSMAAPHQSVLVQLDMPDDEFDI